MNSILEEIGNLYEFNWWRSCDSNPGLHDSKPRFLSSLHIEVLNETKLLLQKEVDIVILYLGIEILMETA